MRNIGAALLLVALVAGMLVGAQLIVREWIPAPPQEFSLDALLRALDDESDESAEFRSAARELVKAALVEVLEESETRSRALIKRALDEWVNEQYELERQALDESTRIDVQADPSNFSSETLCVAAGFSWNAGACE